MGLKEILVFFVHCTCEVTCLWTIHCRIRFWVQSFIYFTCIFRVCACASNYRSCTYFSKESYTREPIYSFFGVIYFTQMCAWALIHSFLPGTCLKELFLEALKSIRSFTRGIYPKDRHVCRGFIHSFSRGIKLTGALSIHHSLKLIVPAAMPLWISTDILSRLLAASPQPAAFTLAFWQWMFPLFCVWQESIAQAAGRRSWVGLGKVRWKSNWVVFKRHDLGQTIPYRRYRLNAVSGPLSLSGSASLCFRSVCFQSVSFCHKRQWSDS